MLVPINKHTKMQLNVKGSYLNIVGSITQKKCIRLFIQHSKYGIAITYFYQMKYVIVKV